MKKSKDKGIDELGGEKKSQSKSKDSSQVEKNQVNQIQDDLIKELQEKNQSLTEENNSLIQLREEHEDFIKRQKAEFDNYRKRVLEEKDRTVLFAGESIMKSFLTIYDNYSKALQVEVVNDEVKAFLDGFKIIKNEMDKFVEEQKVTVSTCIGDTFDPNIHQAILFDESEEAKIATVTEIFQEGYLLNGKLLRTAMVKVTKPKENITQSADDMEKSAIISESSQSNAERQSEQ